MSRFRSRSGGATRELAEIPLIHLSDGSAGTGIACAEAEAGLLPRHPTVVVGRPKAIRSAFPCRSQPSAV